MNNALWLVAESEYAILKIEVNKEWITLIKERLDSPFSHIIEPLGIQQAIGQKDSEDKIADINEVSILKHIRQQLIEKDAEIERLRAGEDKIGKAIEWVDSKLSDFSTGDEYQFGEQQAFEKCKTFLLSL